MMKNSKKISSALMAAVFSVGMFAGACSAASAPETNTNIAKKAEKSLAAVVGTKKVPAAPSNEQSPKIEKKPNVAEPAKNIPGSGEVNKDASTNIPKVEKKANAADAVDRAGVKEPAPAEKNGQQK